MNVESDCSTRFVFYEEPKLIIPVQREIVLGDVLRKMSYKFLIVSSDIIDTASRTVSTICSENKKLNGLFERSSCLGLVIDCNRRVYSKEAFGVLDALWHVK